MTLHTTELTGRLITPAHSEYDEARAVFNAMIDKRPAVIAQCETPIDVVAAIRHARERGLEIAVRGGGHSVAGMSVTDGGLVVDLRRMNGVTVDQVAKTARIGGGATIGHLDRATEPFGLATTGGRVSTTGVAGFTLGGGSGWLERRFGLACDNLLSVDLVTGDGDVVTASADEHPELFWALHGGGGNFGVATSLTFRLHVVPTMTAALLVFEPERGEPVVGAFRDAMEHGPDELGGAVIYATGPEEEFVPEHLQGRLALLILVTFVGTEEQARPHLAPILAHAPAGEAILELPYADLNSMLDDPPGYRNYWSAEHLGSLPDPAIAAFRDVAGGMIVPSGSQVGLAPLGGAVGRATTDYPLPWRTASWVVHPFALWADPADDDRARNWTREVRAAMRPWATGDVYLNFIGDEGFDRVRAGFGAGWDRLVAVKRAYDPDNVFRLNHNITP